MDPNGLRLKNGTIIMLNPAQSIAPLTKGTVLEAYKIMEEDDSRKSDRSRSINTSMYGVLEPSSLDALRMDGSKNTTRRSGRFRKWAYNRNASERH